MTTTKEESIGKRTRSQLHLETVSMSAKTGKPFQNGQQLVGETIQQQKNKKVN